MKKNDSLGIDAIKNTFSSVLDLTHMLVKVLDDGKVSIFELPQLAIGASAIPSIVENGKSALAEFKDLSPAESKKIQAFIKNNFVLDNKPLENHIESGIELLSNSYSFVTDGIDLYKDWDHWIKNFKALRA